MEIAVSLILLLVCALLLYFFYQGPIYVPTLSQTVERMVTAANIKQGMRVADLGSGDGRIAIAFARKGATAVGFEINPLLVWYSRYKVRRAGLTSQVQISTANFWGQNLSEFDVVTVFGINHVMDRLETKLKRELRPGAIVISNAFRLPNLKLREAQGSLLVYEM
jgi:cyclopropane fatty-acyl-phospholipid synthase-like methyltransferase